MDSTLAQYYCYYFLYVVQAVLYVIKLPRLPALGPMSDMRVMCHRGRFCSHSITLSQHLHQRIPGLI